MTKKAVMISIDDEVHKKIKEKRINISEVCEKELRKKLGEDIDTPEEELKCHFCGVHDVRQTPQDLTKGLVFLFHHEVWCCNNCLRGRTIKIIMGATKV